MKIDQIKNALKARITSLNINPLPIAAPILPVVPEKSVVSEKPPVASQSDKNFVKAKPSAAKNSDKNDSPQIPFTHSAQSKTAVKGDKAKVPDEVSTPIIGLFSSGELITPTESPKVPTEKSARKPATRKPKENLVVPAPVIPIPVVAQIDDIEAIVAKHLKAGRDYDQLPNTTKPTLLKSGAEILAGVFGFRTAAKVINRIENYDKQFILYEVCVSVVSKDGNIIAEGLGSCNSRERKYLKLDFATNLNTVLKIAKKRAFVDAILTATNASHIFTQDIEDIVNLQVVDDNRVEHIR